MFLKSLTALLFMSTACLAADYSIFEVRKSLPMENNEVAYKDYYINAGSEVGLKTGMYLSVARNSSVLDPAKNTMQGTLKIPIGKIQIIQVDKHLSVGRLVNQTSNDERASVEFEAFMIGDVIDMDSATMDAPKKRKSASEDEPSLTIKVVEKTAPVVVPTPQVAAVPEKPVPAAPAATPPEMVKLALPPAQQKLTEKKPENIL